MRKCTQLLLVIVIIVTVMSNGTGRSVSDIDTGSVVDSETQKTTQKTTTEDYLTMNEKEKHRFHEMAEQEQKRYDPEMQSFVPPKNVKGPNAPKRSLSAFFWFTNDERSKVRDDNPEYTLDDIAKELGRRWIAADPQTKAKYEQVAEQDKARYDREMAAYKKSSSALDQAPTHAELGVEEKAADHKGEDEYEGVVRKLRDANVSN